MRQLTMFIALAICAGSIGMWLFGKGAVNFTESIRADPQIPRIPAPSSSSPDNAPTLETDSQPSGEAWERLTPSEINQGFQVISQSKEQSGLIVHPHSPCWIELPSPQAKALVQPNPDSGFVGPQECMSCHKVNYASFLETSHYNASRTASSNSILGAFEAPNNRLETNHPDLQFSMTASSDGAFYQDVHFRSLSRRVPFDIVTGAGDLAQTYLFWEGDRLYQMHVSYYSKLDRWINSPGYHDGTAWYARETIPKCVSCHMTYMESLPDSRNRFQRTDVIFGVTCERCHGPGAQHVEFHHHYPGERKSRFITNPSKLSRQATNDVCAQCHLGSAEPLQPPFSFRPGDKLEEFWKVNKVEASQQGNVHSSNQLQRLQMSKCFEGSQMTCLDCHDPHRSQRGDLALYSQRCIRCHEPQACHTSTRLGEPALSNCIDCHMGMGYDDHIQMETTDEIHMPLLRDHNIRLLPDATQRFIEQLLP